MASAVKTTKKTYSYRSGVGGNTDVSIEYSADLSALSRLEVRWNNYSKKKNLKNSSENLPLKKSKNEN